MFDTISAFVSLAAAVAAYILSGHSMLITVLVMVACVLIFRSFRSIFQVKMENAAPPVNVYYIREDNLKNMENRGLRVVVITEKIFFHTETEVDKNYILELIEKHAQTLGQQSPVFKYRYNYVLSHNLPYQSAYAACRNAKSNLKMVYKKWFDTSGVSQFGIFEDDKDSFSVDDTIIDPRDGSEHRAMVQFVFDPQLPVPDANYR